MTAPRLELISGPIKPLTTQQQRVCDGIHRGLSYCEIGRELGALSNKPPISPETVRFYVREAAALFMGLDGIEPRARLYVAMMQKCREGR